MIIYGFFQSSKSVGFLLTVLLHQCAAFYLPGVAPTTYEADEKVPLHVNHLTPTVSLDDAQLRSVFSFDYYHPAFHFCTPKDGAKSVTESLGSILFGDRIQTSPFELYMGKNETCKSLCDPVILDARSAKFVNKRVEQNYDLNWLIDGLPAGQLLIDETTQKEFFQPGFPLGRIDANGFQLNNHYDIFVDYHELRQGKRRVVGVSVLASSRRTSTSATEGDALCGDQSSPPILLSDDGDTTVRWTYGVYWRPSSTTFATRWDRYLHVYQPKIHWFSLVNSAIIVMFLTGMISTILLRALRKDIARYNRLDSYTLDDLTGTSALADDSVQEDSGWKLVHGDVFRTPKQSLLLSVLLGNGAQIFVMTGVTIVFAVGGFLSPSSRGFLGTTMLLLYSLFGFVGGYVSARAYKTFGGEAWRQNIILTPTLVSGIVFGTFLFLNFFLIAKESSGAVPFGTMLVLIGIWFVISIPLSFIGSWIGFKQPPISSPVRTNQIPRQIPLAAGYLRPLPSILIAGILPFGSIFIELYFITDSLWSSQVYYMFGFLFICYTLMVMTCAAVTILMVYFLLCSEDYHWHWRAFFTAGASALYVFLNALIYWFSKLKMGGFTSSVLYLGYSILISFLFFILTGTIGFLSSWAFVHKIYGSIKID